MNSQYLKESVGKYLCKALCELATRRPERPIEFLAYYLISLYEKDLELQRAEQIASSKDSEKSAEHISLTSVVSQMFKAKLSVSRSREMLSASSVATTSSASLAPQMFKERLSISSSREMRDASPEVTLSSTTLGFDSDEPLEEAKKQTDDEEVQETPSLTGIDIYNIPERKLSTINDPVTEEELKEFGTSDPFLARRETKIFDVNFSPIGNNP